MKKKWKKPMLEVLTIGETMGGNGQPLPDCIDSGHTMPPGQYKKHCLGS